MVELIEIIELVLANLIVWFSYCWFREQRIRIDIG